MNSDYCDIEQKAEERDFNELFRAHIKAALKELTLAYNCAENNEQTDTATGLSKIIAKVCQNAEWQGLFD